MNGANIDNKRINYMQLKNYKEKRKETYRKTKIRTITNITESSGIIQKFHFQKFKNFCMNFESFSWKLVGRLLCKQKIQS